MGHPKCDPKCHLLSAWCTTCLSYVEIVPQEGLEWFCFIGPKRIQRIWHVSQPTGWASAFPHIAAYSSCRFDVQPSALSAFFIMFLSFFKSMWVTCVYGCIQAETLLLRFRTFSGSGCPLPCHLIWWSPPLLTLDGLRVFSHGVSFSGHPKSQSVQRVVHEAVVAKGSQPLDPLAACDGILGIPNCNIRAAISTQRCVSIVSNKYFYRDLRWCHVCVTACTQIYFSILNVTGDMWFISAVWQTEGRRSRLRSECCAYSKNSVPPAEFT